MTTQPLSVPRQTTTTHASASFKEHTSPLYRRSVVPTENVDIPKENPKIVANKQQSMEEKLGNFLDVAVSMLKSGISSDKVMAYVRERFAEIENPHRALEEELAKLVEAHTPPNGEYYGERGDRKEFSVAFFHRVYGRFYKTGLLHSHQLRAMDFSLYELVLKLRNQIPLPTKRDANDKLLSSMPSNKEVIRMARVITRRNKAVV